MRSTLRNAVVLIAVLACGCKDEDDDDTMEVFDAGVLPSFDAGADASRADSGGGTGSGTLDSSVMFDAGTAPTDTGTPPAQQDATVTVDAAMTDAGSMDAGGSDASEGGTSDAGGDAGDAGADARVGDAGGDARVDGGRDGGPRDGGRDGSADASGDARVDAGPPATFTRVLEILRSNCASCHTTRSEGQLNVSASAATVYRDLVGVKGSEQGECGGDAPEHIRVIPDEPEDSLLIQKLVDPPCGDRMPRLRDPLAPALINEIRSWIAAGAPEN
jgi:hypothetical protein